MAYHSKTVIDQAIAGQVFCEDDEQRKQDFIFNADNFEFKMIGNPDETKIKLTSTNFNFNLPTDLNFGAVIFEKLKQLSITKKWLKKEYLNMKRKANFTYRNSRKPSTSLNNIL